MHLKNILPMAWCFVLLVPVKGWAAEKKSPGPPNFLFIYTDDQRWDAMSCVQKEQGARARFPWFQTPNMDRLASEGVRFRNAFVVNSLCSPSRTCFLTGRYNHLNGVANNKTPFPVDSVSHATLLHKAGYMTAYVGKWHMDGQKGQRPGFDYSASYIGHGKYNDCPFEIDGTPTETKGWVDDVATDYAIDFIKKNKDKPFDLVLGFKAPHGGWIPPARLKTLYADNEPRPVVNTTLPPYGNPQVGMKEQEGASAGKGDRYPVETIRNYFRTIKGADENVGRLLQLLDDLHLADNTVVIFSSDNGFFLNEHGLGDKRAAYDESMRIPMIVRYPNGAAKGLVRDEMILNIDLAPTLLDLAGVPIPSSMQGRSWKPLFQPGTPEWRHAWFYEYFWEKPYKTPAMFAVRTDDAKIIKYPRHDAWTELFDLKADPYETKNLAKENKTLLKEMMSTYDKEAKAVDFKMPDYADHESATKTSAAAGNE